MAKNYDLLLLLLKKWPVDPQKSTRDFGSHLRQLAKNGFPSGNIFPGSETENRKMLMSLLQLARNKAAEEYPYKRPYAATGYNLKEVNLRLTDKYVDKYFRRK